MSEKLTKEFTRAEVLKIINDISVEFEANENMQFTETLDNILSAIEEYFQPSKKEL
ncbi:MAG: hypothetical protein KAS32_01215 [Candidatus Peribacteraceae bacterium]|nr:hypothetical protein [Candidatus Peribacteraceae bacterium]